eukprot:403365244
MHGFNGALDTLLSRAFGAKQYDFVGHQLNTSRILMLICWLFVTPFMVFSDDILIFLKQDRDSSVQAQIYLAYLVPGMLFLFISDTQRRLLQAFKLVKFQTFIVGISAVIHYFLASYLVINLKMGVKGASIATSLVYLISMILSLLASITQSELRKALIPLKWEMLLFRQLIGIGTYNMLMNSLKWYSFQYLSLLAGAQLGVVEQTSFALVFQYCLSSIQFATGISISVCQIISSNIGQKNYEAAKSYGIFVYQLGFPVSIVFCFVTYFSKYQITRFFTSDPEISSTMLETFEIVTVSIFFDFFQQLQLGIIRGLGLYKVASKANFIAYQIILIPFVTIVLIFVWKDTRVLWITLFLAYFSVNIGYFILIWGTDLKGSSFHKEDQLLNSHKKNDQISSNEVLQDCSDNILYQSIQNKENELRENLLGNNDNKIKSQKSYSTNDYSDSD